MRSRKKQRKVFQCQPRTTIPPETLPDEVYDGYKRRAFVFAMLHLLKHEEFDMEQLLRKVRLQRSVLVDCTNTEQYIILLMKLYNYKQTNKVNLL